jgi:hypothetical protein
VSSRPDDAGTGPGTGTRSLPVPAADAGQAFDTRAITLAETATSPE